jgi:hypothetical protein
VLINFPQSNSKESLFFNEVPYLTPDYGCMGMRNKILEQCIGIIKYISLNGETRYE